MNTKSYFKRQFSLQAFWKQAIICCNFMQQFCSQLKVYTVLYISSQCCAMTYDCIYMTSDQSYCQLHHEIFICEERENLHDSFLYKLLGHWCVWLPENMSYNNEWLRHALPLPLWNGTIHKTLSLCINIYRYKSNIIKKIYKYCPYENDYSLCSSYLNSVRANIYCGMITWHSSLANKAE